MLETWDELLDEVYGERKGLIHKGGENYLHQYRQFYDLLADTGLDVCDREGTSISSGMGVEFLATVTRY